MKKLIAGFVTMAVALAGVCGIMVGQGVDMVKEAQIVKHVEAQPIMEVREVAVEQEPNHNPYTYVVTEINGDEVNGIALDNISFDNAGVVLSKDLDNIQDVKSGDIVQVTYGVALDDIQSVTILDNDDLTEEQYLNLPKAVKDENGRMMTLAEDGTYVTYYNN